jgi:hypothetical protein
MARLTSEWVPHGGMNEFAAYRWFGETPRRAGASESPAFGGLARVVSVVAVAVGASD